MQQKNFGTLYKEDLCRTLHEPASDKSSGKEIFYRSPCIETYANQETIESGFLETGMVRLLGFLDCWDQVWLPTCHTSP